MFAEQLGSTMESQRARDEVEPDQVHLRSHLGRVPWIHRHEERYRSEPQEDSGRSGTPLAKNHPRSTTPDRPNRRAQSLHLEIDG
ncbi:unnamed protein product [Microthlaspi erraticum]|uniref:Uncharacterized protein n=1 Tax=Microthlaspi erraticum TaxID=1685480 RepID=A0A6D2I8P8_9BRAS|nr:unnamed protein product [Microthlaspi erraticum]